MALGPLTQGIYLFFFFGISFVLPSASALAEGDVNKSDPPDAAFAPPLDSLMRYIERKDARIRELESKLERLRAECNSGKPIARKTPANGDTEIPSRSLSTVCHKGCRFSDLGKAVKAARPGDEITVAPEINGSCAVIDKPVRLVAQKGKDGTRSHLAGGVCWGKGPLVVRSPNVVIEGFEISSVAVSSRNGACVRFDPGAENVVLRDIVCRDSENGLLGNVKGRLLIEDSRFERNGANHGQAHGVYVGGEEVVIRRSQILATKNSGHTLKVGARRLLVEDSILAALSSQNSRALDAYAGGEVILRRNVIQQGPNSENNEMLGIAFEPSRLFPAGHSVLLEGNWFIFDDPKRANRKLIAGRKLGTWKLVNNVLVGPPPKGKRQFDDARGNTWLGGRAEAGLPKFDGRVHSLPEPGDSH